MNSEQTPLKLSSQIDSILRSLLDLAADPLLPLHHEARHEKLRKDILKRMIGMIMTDDERAEYLRLPKGCRIRENAKIISPETLICGEYVWIGEGAMLDASGGLEIGEHTSIGLNVMIWSHSSYLTNLTLQNYSNSSLIERKATKIGRGCFISGPSVIMPGVTVGDFCVILPGSVVNKDVPERSLVCGTSSKVLAGYYTDEIINEKVSIQQAREHEKQTNTPAL